jgi:hypothetical protein
MWGLRWLCQELAMSGDFGELNHYKCRDEVFIWEDGHEGLLKVRPLKPSLQLVVDLNPKVGLVLNVVFREHLYHS